MGYLKVSIYIFNEQDICFVVTRIVVTTKLKNWIYKPPETGCWLRNKDNEKEKKQITKTMPKV